MSPFMATRIAFSVWYEKRTNPPSETQFGCGGGEFKTAASAIRDAQKLAAQFECIRQPDRETADLVFIAERFVPWQLPVEHCPHCHGTLPSRHRGGRRAPIPGVPIGEHYIVKAYRREYYW